MTDNIHHPNNETDQLKAELEQLAFCLGAFTAATAVLDSKNKTAFLDRLTHSAHPPGHAATTLNRLIAAIRSEGATTDKT